MTDDEIEAELVLINHQRTSIRGCGCGWAELGKSHPAHVLAELRRAGLRLVRMAREHVEEGHHG